MARPVDGGTRGPPIESQQRRRDESRWVVVCRQQLHSVVRQLESLVDVPGALAQSGSIMRRRNRAKYGLSQRSLKCLVCLPPS